VRELAFKYNTKVAFHPRMHRELRRADELDDYTKWAMVREDGITTSQEPCKPPTIPGSSKEYKKKT
jgi:hypothetical protein